MSEQDDAHYIVAAGVDDSNANNEGGLKRSNTEFAEKQAAKQALRLKKQGILLN